MRSKEELQGIVKRFFRSQEAELTELGNWFWKNPEPGYREQKTSAMAVKKLRELGLSVRTGLALTGFRTVIDTGKPGPCVAVLGELDSLIIPSHPDADPGTGAVHACGHNSSLTALIGTAMALTRTDVTQDLCGKIVLIGCPAEEGIEMAYRTDLVRQGKIRFIAGKPELIAEGAFDDVDLALLNHVSGRYGYNDHNGCVNKMITFLGKSCHAARPEEGHNALNAANLALHAIGLLRESCSASGNVRIHGIITSGGESMNVIPAKVTMEYMLRAPSIKEIITLNDRFDNILLHAAKAAECEAEVATVSGYMPLLNDPDLGKVLGDAVQIHEPGAEFDDNRRFFCSCTDMGDVSTIMPAVHGYVPGSAGSGHTADFRIAAPEKAYAGSAELAVLTLLELLHGDGEKAKAIAAKKKDLMPIPEYVKNLEGLNRVVRSRDL